MSAQPAPKKDDKKPDATKQADAAKAAPPKDPKKADSQTDMNAQPTQYQGVHSFLAHGSKFIVDTKYAPLKPLGRGAYGVVVSCLDKTANKKVAIKKIPKAFDDLVDAKRILREVKLLRHFKHENIVGLRDFIPPPTDTESLEDIYMVLDFMETDLHKIIYSRNELTDEHIQYFVYQMLRALKYIHSAHVIHRDLKPSNLLLNGNCDLKICDFGLARGVKEEEDYELTEYVVTRWYRAPEVMCSCQEYDHKIDVWSVGCILGELHGRKPLFPGDDYIKQMNLIFNVLGTPTKQDMAFITNDKASDYIKSLEKRPKVPFSKIYPDANPLALDLLDKMLTFSPHKRISIEEALKHPYLAGLHNPKKEFECKDRFDFDFEKIEMTKEILQDFMWEEIYLFRSERRIKGQPKKTDKWFAMAEQKRKAKEEAKKKRMTNTGTGTGKRSTADKKDSGILAAVQANQAQAAGIPHGPSGSVSTAQPKSNIAGPAPGSSSQQPIQQRP